MIEVSERSWQKYIDALRQVNNAAADRMLTYLQTHDVTTEAGRKAAIDYAYALATKYGDAAAELSCEMYDAMALLSGQTLPAAIPAATATYEETATAVIGTLDNYKNAEIVSSAVGRLVKMAGADTALQNAVRDHAEFAWIPQGETCAFCLMIASNGWQPASRSVIKGGHADHIHANCDCMFAIRFMPDTKYDGYDPEKYREMWDDAEGSSTNDKLNFIRREFYAENKAEINAQKRDAYAKRQELNASTAEEVRLP